MGPHLQTKQTFLSKTRCFLTFAHDAAEMTEQEQDYLGKRMREFPCPWRVPSLDVIQFIWLLTTSLPQSSSFQISAKPNLQAGTPLIHPLLLHR